MLTSLAAPTPSSVVTANRSVEPTMRAAEPAEATAGTVTLNTLPRMARGMVVGYAEADSPDALRSQRRLAELGFLPGERVQVMARGWFKRGPLAVRVGDSTFALRDDEAAMLKVRPL